MTTYKCYEIKKNNGLFTVWRYGKQVSEKDITTLSKAKLFIDNIAINAFLKKWS
jgi:hypothetical protein